MGFDSPIERARLLEGRNAELLGTGAVDPETYVLGPGDLVGLEVAGAFSLSAEDLIAADGTVTFPQLGTLELSGLTLARAQTRVAERGREIVRSSTVRLLLKSTRSFKVYVVGSVGKPGAVRATAVMRTSEAVQAAGGFAGNGSLRGVQVVLPDGTVLAADIVPFLLRGRLDTNPSLTDGAVVVVPPVGHRIEVTGASEHPGAYDYVDGDELGTFLDVVGLAASADSSRVVIQRFTSGSAWDTLGVPLRPVLRGEVRVPLRPRDRILIRSLGDYAPDAAVRVDGAVAHPGPVPVERGRQRVADVIALAGGVLPDASLQRVVLTRRFDPDSIRVGDPAAGRNFVAGLTAYSSREEVVDLTGGPGPLVMPGDVVSVPRRRGFVQVLGQVKHPGYYDHEEGWSPGEYIDAAGGYAKLADKGQTRVTRGNHGDVAFADDVEEVAPGDLLWVPERPPTSFWQTVRDVSGLVTSALTVYLLIREAQR